MCWFLCKNLENRDLQKHTAQYGTNLYFPPEKQRISLTKRCEKNLNKSRFELKIAQNNSRGFESNTLKTTILELQKILKKFAPNWIFHNYRPFPKIYQKSAIRSCQRLQVGYFFAGSSLKHSKKRLPWVSALGDFQSDFLPLSLQRTW